MVASCSARAARPRACPRSAWHACNPMACATTASAQARRARSRLRNSRPGPPAGSFAGWRGKATGAYDATFGAGAKLRAAFSSTLANNEANAAAFGGSGIVLSGYGYNIDEDGQFGVAMIHLDLIFKNGFDLPRWRASTPTERSILPCQRNRCASSSRTMRPVRKAKSPRSHCKPTARSSSQALRPHVRRRARPAPSSAGSRARARRNGARNRRGRRARNVPVRSR